MMFPTLIPILNAIAAKHLVVAFVLADIHERQADSLRSWRLRVSTAFFADLLTVDESGRIWSTSTEVVGGTPMQMRRTMRCNGAGLARFYEWKVNRPGPLIATFSPLNHD
jgi:hypothetical protein